MTKIYLDNGDKVKGRTCFMRDEIVIEAGQLERHYWLDLWRYRELFRALAWRDLLVRYKQTVYSKSAAARAPSDGPGAGALTAYSASAICIACHNAFRHRGST